MANLVPKIPAETWLATARSVLAEEGIAAVKVDSLAQRLGVTRGGFYHHFRDRADLLERLLEHWEEVALFLPPGRAPRDPAEALAVIDAQVRHLIEERDYDPRFDMAVRAWGQADATVAAAVERMDRRRIAALTRIFVALGCERLEAAIRARVLYFHQIGYYAIGVRATAAARLRAADRYVRILCGEDHLERARAWASSQAAQRPASVRRARVSGRTAGRKRARKA
jgi:AcrR family transcriptional regulator